VDAFAAAVMVPPARPADEMRAQKVCRWPTMAIRDLTMAAADSALAADPLFLVGKAIFLIMAFGIPALFHPVWVVLSFYAVAALVLGMTLSVVFQLAHCVEQADTSRSNTTCSPGSAISTTRPCRSWWRTLVTNSV
jgi:hypothetical protein